MECIEDGTTKSLAMDQKTKIFTQSVTDKIREPLKKNSGTQLNSGFDSEIMQAGIQLAGFHIEAGAKSFTEYSKAMVRDIGDAIKPYLWSFYEGVRYYPGFDSKDMTAPDDINVAKDQKNDCNKIEAKENEPTDATDNIRGPEFRETEKDDDRGSYKNQSPQNVSRKEKVFTTSKFSQINQAALEHSQEIGHQKVRSILEILKFEKVWNEITDQQPSYFYNFGNLKLIATQVTSKYFRPIFSFYGIIKTDRIIEAIDFTIPIEVESFEQGVAWISFGIKESFQPDLPTPWLSLGRGWKNHLPWVREQQEYKNRPQCDVDRVWFRIAAKQMRDLADGLVESDLALFEFDGDVLRISVCGQVFAMPAKGNAWKEPYTIKAKILSHLAKRLMKPIISIGVWKEHLFVHNLKCPLVPGIVNSSHSHHD